MSNPERGAYTPPTDAPLAFDARQPVRGRGPAPMMLILSAIVLIILVVAIAVFYRSGLHQGSGPPPTVGTPVGQIKGPASAGSQPVDPAAGLQIYRSTEGQAAPAQPNFTPPPETPQSRAPVVAAPPPAASAPPQAAPKPAPTTAVTAQPAGPVAALPVTQPPAKSAPAVLKPAISATAPALKPADAAATPAKTPAAPKPVEAAAPKPAAAASGAAMVQIGAFSSQTLADRGWSDAARIAPGAAAGKGKKVEAIQKDGATLYRTAVTGFATRAEAAAFCDKLKAAGKSCFVK
jgi:hypothetical protein